MMGEKIVSAITGNLRSIQNRIKEAALRSGRDPAAIQLITVTKRVASEKINEAISAGVTVIGENKVQEARDKFPQIAPCTRYLIGNLQKNKVKYVFDLFTMIQSVDSIELAVTINKKAETVNRVMETMVQVNISGEESKSGIEPSSAQGLVTAMQEMSHVRVKGLMCIPPFSVNPEDSRPFFRQLTQLGTTINKTLDESKQLNDYSMGMTNDFEVAIEEGATMVRVGTGIFGGRD